MKYFYRFRRILCLILAIILMMPSNLPSILHATTGNSDNTSSVVSEVDVDENTSSVSSEEITMESEDTALPEGFQLHIEWDDSEFKDGTAYNIIEDTNTNNSVKLRVSYSNNQVSETGYQPGELIITVKGIGALNRSGTVEAQVGADKASASTKNREWSYTWSKTKDTYTFTNNKTIEPNTVLSGYFDILWTFNSKNTIHEYYQDDICAELLLPDGNSKQSETLSISNSTICDEYTIDIDKAPLYSSSGVAGNIIDYEKFTFIKYSLTSYLNNKSRGVNEDKETFIFDTDCTDIGNGGIITYSNIAYSSLEEGLYEVSLKNNQTVGNQYVIVAYPKETYLGKQTTASITSYGTYFEGDNEGNFDEVQLATDSIEFAMPADFDFEDTGGLFHELKESDYEQLIYKDKKFNDKFIKNGGHLQGQRMYLGTTESFYLGFSIDYPPAKDTHYSIEFIDDFLYIAQNNGNYRQLTYEDYEIKDVVILSTKNVFNENNVNVQHGVYPVKVYALQNGNLFTREQNSPEGFYENESALVWEGLWENYDQKIALPAGTNTVLIRIENLTEALYPTWTGQQNFEIYEPIVKLNIKFHLDEENLPEDEKANLSEGQLVNTMYLNYYDTNKTLINYDDNEEDYLDEDINLDLAQIDLDTYGRYLDRDKGSFSFYAGEKSDYKAYTDLSNITQKGKIFTAKMTIGADFDYAEEETPNKFSLYTVLPENVSLHNYELEEDLWDILTFSGMDLDADTLATHCSVEIDENYQNSGRTYIALHFDFKENPLPKLTNIRVAFTVKIDKNYFKQSKSTVNVKSVVKIDDVINSYNIGKVNDDGLWDTDSALLSDIDKNGETLELIAYNYDFSTYTYVDSSELQITKSIKTSSIEDFIQLPEVPLAEQGSLYTYELTVKNGNNTSTDLIITDILENGNNSEWKGTFDSINLSEADKLGMTYTIYYATKSDIGTLGEDSNWQIYDEGNTDKTQIKAIAIDFGTSVLDIGKELNIHINMIAPSDDHLKDKITENNFNISFTMTSVSGNDTQTSYNSLDSNYVQAKLTAPLKNLVLTKVDEENNSILSGAKYSLIEKDTQKLIAQGITNSRGQITFKDIPSDKTYVLREDEAPQGYELGENYEFTFDENKTLRITLSDKRKTGTIELIKRNYLDNLLMVEGAEFTLFNMDGIEIQKAVTNINGKAVFKNIPWGEYYLQETTAPDGYVLDETVYNVKLTRENVHEIQKFTMTNTQDGSTLIILNKYVMTSSGVQTDIPLQGAVFELVRVTGGQSNVLGTYVTDKNGEIIIEDLAYGDYILREARVPTGYYKTENIAVTLSPTNKEASLIAYDKRKPGSINIFKKDNLDNIVEGAVFELYDETKNNVLETYTTDASGNIFINDLEWGTYYLREKSTLDCYKLNQEWIEIVIDGNTLDIDLTCINETKKGTIVLTKTDELGYPITNNSAEFALYNADGTLLQEGLTTDENGELRVENLEWGNYYFKETKAPIGYGLTDETIRFAVNSMNAGVEQSIYVSDPVKSKTITITKKIFVDDINFENGDPTFLFKVNGTDISDKEHTYYRIIRFDKNYVETNTDEEGYVSQSVTVSGIIAGIYNITEEESSRYVLDLVETTSSNTSINQKVATTDLTFEDFGDATFTNIKYEHDGFSDNKSLANSLKVQTKLTGLKATWLGEPEVEVYTEIDRNLVEVTALYDDGTFKKLTNEDWAFGDSFEGSSFPNINGIYYIPIAYTENGITKTASFEITLYGAIKEKIIRLEAAVKDEYSTLPPNYALSPDMFNVTAVYNDGSKTALSTNCTTTITSPNYPNNYSNGHSRTWKASYPGATSLKVVFDYFYTYNSSDYVYVRDSSGKNISAQLYGTKTGTTVTVNDSELSIYMYTNGTGTAKGFSATVYPLDVNGNVITETDIVLNPNRTSIDEGISEIEISLNNNRFTENVSTTVNIFTKNYEPLLIKGEEFYSQIPSSATAILFTDEEAPTGAIITDLSLEKNRSVSAWLDGTTWKISTQRKGVKSIAHENCRLMFSNSKLVSIDCTYLDTSRVTSMFQMFNNCTSLTTLDIGGFNTSNVTDMSNMFYYCSKLTSLDVSSFNTSKVTDMSSMFDKSGLVSLDLSNFDTSNVTDMSQMFYICDDLVNLNINNFNTSKVTDMACMFESCKSLTTLDVSNFITTNVKSMSGMFRSCYSLKELNLSSFDTSNLPYKEQYGPMSGMFSGCHRLEKITLPNTFSFMGEDSYLPINYSGYWYDIETNVRYNPNEIPNNKAATYVSYSDEYTGILSVYLAHLIPNNTNTTKIIFTNTTIPDDVITYDLSAAQDQSILGWSVGTNFYISSTQPNTKVLAHSNSASMFEDLAYITSIDFSYLDTSAATTLKRMFYSCDKLKVDVSKLDTSNVTDMSSMFSWMGKSNGYITITGINKLNVSKVTNMNSMFNKTFVSSLDLSGWDTSNVTDMSQMFNYCYCSSLNLNNINTSNVKTMYGMFWGCEKLTSLDLSSFNTSNVTDMGYMFHNCGKLTSLNINSFNTSNVTNMSNMFVNCYGFTSLDVSALETTNVTDMSRMFFNCQKLTSLDLSTFDTSNVTDMSEMFSSCSGLVTLDLSTFNTSNVTDMNQMFNSCRSLTTLDLGDFNTSKVTDMSQMFSYCQALTGLNVSSFDTTNVTNMGSMFNYCSALTSLDLSSFYTTNVTSMGSMFNYCSALTSLDLSNFNTTNVTNSNSMFNSNNYLATITLGNAFTLALPTPSSTYISGADGYWYNQDTFEIYVADQGSSVAGTYVANPIGMDSTLIKGTLFKSKIPSSATSIVFTDITAPVGFTLTDLSRSKDNSVVAWLDGNTWYISTQQQGKTIKAHPDCKEMFSEKKYIISIDCSNLDTSRVFTMEKMFCNCTNLKSLNVSSFNTSKLIGMGMYNMFYGCNSLTSLDLSSFDTSNITNMRYLFDDCMALTSLDISSFNTSKVTDMAGMFSDCSSLTSLDVSNFDTSKATVGNMFRNCSSLTELDVSSFDVSNITSLSYMFYGCSSLTSLDLSNFNTSGITNMNYMFDGCTALETLDISSFDTSNVTYMENMFNNCNNLLTVSIGEKFTGTLPTPNATYIDHADGKWYNTETHIGYYPDEIPAQNATYVALQYWNYGSTLKSGPELNKLIPNNITSIIFTDQKAPDGASLIDVSTYNDNSIVAWVEDTTYYISTQNENTKIKAHKNCSNMFSNYNNLASIDLSNLDTSNVINMSNMFNGSTITSLDLSNFDTSNVINMSYMFSKTNIASLDLSNFNTFNVTNMNNMFSDSIITTLNLNNFNTTNVTDMNYIFNNCAELTNITLGKDFKFINDNTYLPEPNSPTGLWYNVETKEGYTPYEIPNYTAATYTIKPDWLKYTLITGDLIHEIIPENTTSIIFTDIKAPENIFTIDISAFSDNSVVAWLDETTIYISTQTEGQKVKAPTVSTALFADNPNLTTIDLANFDTSLAIYMDYMFAGCSSLVNLDLSNFNTSNATTMNGMFAECVSLPEIDLSSFNTINVTDMSHMFHDCQSLETINVSNINTSNTEYINWMFAYCTNLTEIIGIEDWDVSNVVDMYSMFNNCTSLQSLDLSRWNTGNVESMAWMFNNCIALESITFGGAWDTSNTVDMSHMFHDCQSLETIDVSNFDVSNTEYINWMFAYCTSLTEIIGIENWDTSNVVDMYSMFNNCENLTRLDLSNFDMSNVEYTDYMFYNCYEIAEALARSQVDANILNNSHEKPEDWEFISTAQEIELTINNQCSDLVDIDLPEKIESKYTKITLIPKDNSMYIESFKLNGDLIKGNSFMSPESDATVTITDVVLKAKTFIVESEHNPYPNSLSDKVYGEHTFEGATSLTVVLDYQTESTTYDWIYLYDSNGNTYGKYGGSTRTTTTITIPGDYIKVVFRTDGSVNSYYGFKATITPNFD